MRSVVLVLAFDILAFCAPRVSPAAGEPEKKAPTPELVRTISLENVLGATDRTGIAGRIDHMRCDPESNRLFIACVANGSLEAIDLEKGVRAGSITGLRGPQGVAVAAGWVYLATGDDGKLHRFDSRTLVEGKSVAVGDDADNVRVAGDGKVWVSFGGNGPGGLSCFDANSLALEKTFSLARMPEGFQVDTSGDGIFANMPAGKRSKEDGTVVGLKYANGGRRWERKLVGRAGNFPMALDAAHGRLLVVSRTPARLICLDAREGSILGEAACPPESDDLFFDARSGLIAVIGGGTAPTTDDPGGSGASVDLFELDESGRLAKLSGTPLPPHSRTGALYAERRAIYVGVPGTKDRPPRFANTACPGEASEF